MSRAKSSTRVPDVDPKSAVGAALTTAVQTKLRSYLGADYVDRSLAQYVVIMLAHKTGQQGVGDNLVEFLGEVDAREAASWLFENLDELAKAPPPPKAEQQRERRRHAEQAPAAATTEDISVPVASPAEQQQAQQQAQQQQGQRIEGEAQEHEDLALELEVSENGMVEAGGDEGSDADTAEVAPGGGGSRGGHDDGPAALRRLQSAVVVDEHRRSGGRRARSRSQSRGRYSPPPRRRRSHSPSRLRSPPRRRSPPRAGQYFWEGSTGMQYRGHDPYPYRGAGDGSGWRAERSPPRRRSPSPYRGRASHSHGHSIGGGDAAAHQQRPWSPRAAHPQADRWGQAADGASGGGGGGSGVFGRLHHQEAGGGGGGGGWHRSRQQQFSQHDLRWEGDEEEGPHRRHHSNRLAGGGGRLQPAAEPPHDAAWGRGDGYPAEHPHHRHHHHPPQQQQQQQERGQQFHAGMVEELSPGRRTLAATGQYGGLGQEREQQQQQQQQPRLAPWERPSYMDLELERQRQQQQQQAQQQQVLMHQAAAQGRLPPGLSLARTVASPPATSTFAGAPAGSLPAQPGDGQPTTFQVTFSQQEHAARRTPTAPLLQQPDLQAVLQRRLRRMELQLVALRADQAQRQLEAAQAQQTQQEEHHHLSMAARLDQTVRSVCIRGVHRSASDRVLIAHFGSCGYIQRITHLRDPVSGARSGVVYMQFAAAAQAQAALALDGSALLQRAIQVVPSDSPAARVATSRVLRASFPPSGPVPMPLCAAPHGGMASSRTRYRLGGGRGEGSSGRGSGKGPSAFKYVRPAEQQQAAGSDNGGVVAAAVDAGMDTPAPAGGDQHMAD